MRRPSTSAAIVPKRPAPSRKMSFASSAKWCFGSVERRKLPTSAPASMVTKAIDDTAIGPTSESPTCRPATRERSPGNQAAHRRSRSRAPAPNDITRTTRRLLNGSRRLKKHPRRLTDGTSTPCLIWVLFDRVQRGLLVGFFCLGGCPLRSDSDRVAARQRDDVMCQDQTCFDTERKSEPKRALSSFGRAKTSLTLRWQNRIYEDTTKHYFGRFIHVAGRCKSIFGSAGIAAAVVERRARGLRGAWRAKSAEAEARGFFFFRRLASARRRCWRNAYAIIVMSACR